MSQPALQPITDGDESELEELEELVDDNEEREAEDKWRSAAVQRLRDEADRIEKGGRLYRVYYTIEVDHIAATEMVRDAVAEFNAGNQEGDEWGLYVPIQWRVMEVRGAR